LWGLSEVTFSHFAEDRIGKLLATRRQRRLTLLVSETGCLSFSVRDRKGYQPLEAHKNLEAMEESLCCLHIKELMLMAIGKPC